MNKKTKDKKFTLADIAKVAGVTTATVSKALNNRSGVSDSVRQQILKIMAENGYQKRLSQGGSAHLNSVTIITHDRYASGGMIYSEILNGISEEAEKRNIKLDLRVLPDYVITQNDLETLFAHLQPESLLLLGLDSREVLDYVMRFDCPKLIANGMDEKMGISSVTVDDRFGGWLAARHVLENGHRKIVHVSHLSRRAIRHRLDGFRDALEEFGIAYDATQHLLAMPQWHHTSSDAKAVVEAYLCNGRPNCTAFVCASDLIAIGTAQALNAAGYNIPGDFSIIGFDNIFLSEHHAPPLSSIQVGFADVGRNAMRELQDQFSKSVKGVRRINLGVKLVARRSVASLES